MSYNSTKSTYEIIEKLRSYLESVLVDPYEQSTSKTRFNFVKGTENFSLNGLPPILHIVCLDSGSNVDMRIGQTKTAYLEQESHNLMIYYYCQQGHRYTFPSNSLTLINGDQCRNYLRYVKNTLKINMTEFDLFFHQHKFGNIAQPTRIPKTSLWVSALPFSIKTYHR